MSNEKIWELIGESVDDMANINLDYISKILSLIELADEPEEFEELKEGLSHYEALFKIIL